ncbi:hypothetical protein CBS101457_004045 [Exobasidium rhododendri]|nr:hypothetical protein CBS101457_004045 [Exobasidium rhododendri]
MANDSSLQHVASHLAGAMSSPEVKRIENGTKSITSAVLHSPPLLVTTTLGCGAASYLIYWRYFKRIPTTAYLTPSVLRWRKILVGRCTSVGDADGFRLYHTPGPPLYRALVYGESSHDSKKKAGQGTSKAISHHRETLSIRLAGADAPESSHFGKPSQPMAKEAKEELEKLVLGHTVWCQAAHVDQYARLVATPYVFRSPYIFGRTNVSLHLVKKGFATVYTQTGASYGSAGLFSRTLRWMLRLKKVKPEQTSILDRIFPLSGEARLKRAQARAKRKKIGVWSLKHFESPEDYKKRNKMT